MARSTDRTTADGRRERADRTGRFDVERLRGGLDRALLVGFVLLGAFAAMQFYSQAGRAIRTWVAPEYQPFFLALFNLAVLLVAAVGVSRQLRRLGAAPAGEGEEAAAAAVDGSEPNR